MSTSLFGVQQWSRLPCILVNPKSVECLALHMSKLLIIFLFIYLIGSDVTASGVVVYRNESMPWCGTVDGKDAGITIDILNAVTKYGGPTFNFIAVPWKRAQVLIQNNRGTAIIPFTRTATREQHHTWIIELVPNQVRLTMARKPTLKVSVPSPPTLVNFKNSGIGIIRGSAVIPAMKTLGFTNLYEVNKAEQLAKMLNTGRFVAMAESKWVDNYVWNKIGQKGDDLIVGPNVGGIKYIFLGAALNFPPELTHQIRTAMEKVRKSGALDKILNKWTKL